MNSNTLSIFRSVSSWWYKKCCWSVLGTTLSYLDAASPKPVDSSWWVFDLYISSFQTHSISQTSKFKTVIIFLKNNMVSDSVIVTCQEHTFSHLEVVDFRFDCVHAFPTNFQCDKMIIMLFLFLQTVTGSLNFRKMSLVCEVQGGYHYRQGSHWNFTFYAYIWDLSPK